MELLATLKDWLLTVGVSLVANLAKKVLQKKPASPPTPPQETIPNSATLTSIWKPSPNFSSRNKGVDIDAIILHHTDSTVSSALSWVQSKDSQVSYHYLISNTGDIYQIVKDTDKAWHAGVSALFGKQDANEFSIGIAFEGSGVAPTPYTNQQYEVAAALCKRLKSTYPKITNTRIVSHAFVALPPGRKTDVSPLFDWHRFYGLIDR